MERYQKIINNIEYLKHAKKIDELEETRIFCKHGTDHFIAVARIAMLININENYGIKKDIIYAAALLHDIGRDVEYTDRIRHEIASKDIAEIILKDTDYSEDEVADILKAIIDHRTDEIKTEKSLSGLIYRADKQSRPCYLCNSYNECNKAYEKRNGSLIW